MRNCFALAFAVAALAAPLHGQRAQPVFHGDGFDIVLPSKFAQVSETSRSRNGMDTEMSTFGYEDAAVIVSRVVPRISDTTATTRLAMLQFARLGMLEAGDGGTVLGEPAAFERGDRVGWRMQVRTTPGGKDDDTPVYGTAEISFARQGEMVMWLVLYLDPRQSTAGTTAERLLDSFHLTDAAPLPGEARGFRVLDENPKSGKAEKTNR